MNLNQVIIKPITTEKIHRHPDQYGFWVNPKVNKAQVSEAVELLYGVKVVSVRMTILKPVSIRTGRRRLPSISSYKKKAIINLKPGQSLTLIESKE